MCLPRHVYIQTMGHMWKPEDSLQSLLCGSKGLNSGLQAWQQEPVPVEHLARPLPNVLPAALTTYIVLSPRQLSASFEAKAMRADTSLQAFLNF